MMLLGSTLRGRLRVVAFWSVCALAWAPRSFAEVSRVEIASRTDVAFAGYERIAGRVFFVVDPADSRNAVIAGLETAPRNAQGRVEFSADFSVLRPKSGGNGAAILDVPNRGNGRAVPMFNRARGNAGELGDGFLMQRGFTVVLVGWQHDIAGSGANLLRIQVPGTPPIGGLGFAAVRDVVCPARSHRRATCTPSASRRAGATSATSSTTASTPTSAGGRCSTPSCRTSQARRASI
jgi:hypothetical protein